MPTLINLAQEKNLPYHQYMDLETLERIKNHNPFLTINQESKISLLDICNIAIKNIDKIPVPKLDWFLKEEEYETIHGVRHLYRVGIIGLILGTIASLSDKDSDSLLRCCILHDIRRLHDKDDVEHGERCAIWFKQNHNQIIPSIKDIKQIDSIAYLISVHDTAGQEIEKDMNLEKNLKLLSLLKTSDALDRFRLPKLKRRINDDFLDYVPSLELKIFAYQLVVESEKIYLQKRDGVASIKDALLILKEKYAR